MWLARKEGMYAICIGCVVTLHARSNSEHGMSYKRPRVPAMLAACCGRARHMLRGVKHEVKHSHA